MPSIARKLSEPEILALTPHTVNRAPVAARYTAVGSGRSLICASMIALVAGLVGLATTPYRLSLLPEPRLLRPPWLPQLRVAAERNRRGDRSVRQ